MLVDVKRFCFEFTVFQMNNNFLKSRKYNNCIICTYQFELRHSLIYISTNLMENKTNVIKSLIVYDCIIL